MYLRPCYFHLVKIDYIYTCYRRQVAMNAMISYENGSPQKCPPVTLHTSVGVHENNQSFLLFMPVLNRRFPETTGEDNLTVFSYSGRVKSPEWMWRRRGADLHHFEIFRHGPIIIYTRLPAGGTYYPICTFPAGRECLSGISDAFSAFCLRVSVIFPTCSLYPQQKRAYSALHPQAWTYIYRSMPEGSYRVQSPAFPKIVYWANVCSRT